MKKLMVMLSSSLALVFCPFLVLAAPQADAAREPAPNPAAYEHADEKAGFQRDTHDLGLHKGQEEDKDQDKDQDKGKDKGKPESDDAHGKDKAKSKYKSKSKDKSNLPDSDDLQLDKKGKK